jgi:hypothetical protein
MKKIIRLGISLLLVTVGFVSCNTTDSVNLNRNVKPIVNLVDSNVSVEEGGTAAITITTSDIASKDIIFKLVQVGGDAVVGVDYKFADADTSAPDYGVVGGRVVIPAYATTGSVNIIGLKTYTPQGKTATFELRAIQSLVGVAGAQTNVTATFVITQAAGIDIVYDWPGTFLDASGNTQSWGDYDLDLELYTSAGDYVDGSYSSYPEHFNYAVGDLPDGDYMVVPEYWASGASPAVNTQVPASLFFGVAGSGSATIDLSSVWDTDTGGYDDGNPNWYVWGKYILTVAGSSFTVTDNDTGDVLFSN